MAIRCSNQKVNKRSVEVKDRTRSCRVPQIFNNTNNKHIYCPKTRFALAKATALLKMAKKKKRKGVGPLRTGEHHSKFV
jgi:hypothetical protein